MRLEDRAGLSLQTLPEGDVMRYQENKLEALPPAAVVGLSKVAKIVLIRKFQRMEGNFDCCASAYSRVCKQFDCLWRDECSTMLQD